MRITFTETESRERSYFEQELADHELNFGPSLADTEILFRFHRISNHSQFPGGTPRSAAHRHALNHLGSYRSG
jgi:hypothetical protein